MVFRRKSPQGQLSGADYLMATAEALAEDDHPWAMEFGQMVRDCFTQGPLAALSGPTIAKRPLEPLEASAVGSVVTAYDLAMKNRDLESAAEIVQLGASLVAKWDEYLAVRPDGHPKFDIRIDGEEYQQRREANRKAAEQERRLEEFRKEARNDPLLIGSQVRYDAEQMTYAVTDDRQINTLELLKILRSISLSVNTCLGRIESDVNGGSDSELKVAIAQSRESLRLSLRALLDAKERMKAASPD